jgi:hypothetical protein
MNMKYQEGPFFSFFERRLLTAIWNDRIFKNYEIGGRE